MFDYILDKREEMDIKNKMFRQSKLITDGNGSSICLDDLFELNNLKNRSYLQNQMNTLFTFLGDFDLCFFTLTQKSEKHKVFEKLNDNEKIMEIKNTKYVYNNYFRTLLMSRLFKTLKTGSRFYVRSSELHKSFMLHEHCSFFVKKGYITNLVIELIRTYHNSNLGRFEMVLDKKFMKQLLSLELKKIVRIVDGKRQTILVNSYLTTEEYKTGEYFYIRFLTDTKEEQKVQLTKYVMKYVVKASYNKKEELTEREKIERAIFLAVKVRRISFSRFLFSKTLYHTNFKTLSGVKLYEKYTLRDLTILKNNGDISFRFSTNNFIQCSNINYTLNASDFEDDLLYEICEGLLKLDKYLYNEDFSYGRSSIRDLIDLYGFTIHDLIFSEFDFASSSNIEITKHISSIVINGQEFHNFSKDFHIINK